ncbi:hypothetical protein E2C01_053453 [Portunus trituberculatus]|uniref:Uncharacterized protein n=1 Tax=Portunus trituberculatus TaxID=210409 RepID=A0A5B7GS45_PORTR|nr:hypothetical protein [Portunus trituberculatus]
MPPIAITWLEGSSSSMKLTQGATTCTQTRFP